MIHPVPNLWNLPFEDIKKIWFLKALDKCYGLYKEKSKRQGEETIDLNSFDAVLFHSPYCKLVQKSLARLAFNDFKANSVSFPDQLQSSFAQISLEDSYFNKDVEKAFMELTQETFANKTQPSLLIATNVGNMYTSSLYGGLVSFLCSHDRVEDLVGKRVALFSYGSGLVSSFFSIKVKDESQVLTNLHSSLNDVHHRLKSRLKVCPQDFAQTMKLREETHHVAPYQPVATTQSLFPATWYLASVDDKYRRKYLKNWIIRHKLAKTGW